MLSSHSRLHGSASYRVPWLFDQKSNDVVRFFTKLKCSLMPYLFKSAVQSTQSGLLVMRAMVMEFQNDQATYYLERQYMLGDSLLVVPVLNEMGEVSYYLPRGRWVSFLTGEVIEGGSWQTERHDYLSLPLLVRPNSIVAVDGENGRPDYDYARTVTLFISRLEQGAKANTIVYNENGVDELTFSAQREGNVIMLTASGVGKPWTVRFAKGTRALSAQDASISESGKGLIITPDHFTGTIKVVIG